MARRKIEEIDPNLKAAKPESADTLQWFDVSKGRIPVRGLAWFKQNGGQFFRLPLRAEGIVRPDVWYLSQSPASGHLAFRSNATEMAVRVVNQHAGVMAHMPGTGSNGLALYGGTAHRLRPLATAIPDPNSPAYESQLFKGADESMREYRLYLPLYCELQKLEIAVNRGAKILAPTVPSVSKPVVFYGTSITQGGCASTAGSDFVSTVGRLLNVETVNLGFSGNGRGEPELAELVSEIDASLYVLDYAANSTPEGLRKTLPRFVRILRERRPDVPILIMTHLLYGRYNFDRDIHDRVTELRDIALEFYVKQRRNGIKDIHIVDAWGLLPFGSDGVFVDGAHPTDHGFQIMAERLAPVIESILASELGLT